MAKVTYEKATRHYPGNPKPSVDSIDLDIRDGEFLVLVGPSGCGKSTTLRMLAGLEPTDSGTIAIGDRDVTKVRPRDRDVAMVFQSYALYPNMTTYQNMGFALENQKVEKSEIDRRVREAAKILELTDLLDRKPAHMSGGQRQRVAMGRAIVREPAVFCMDEPLSNLDAKLRVSTRSQISRLQDRLGTTTVYVTHDQVEAMTLGDRVAVLLDGVLQQVAEPTTLYNHPINTFVAGFIGSPAVSLFKDVEVKDGVALLAGKSHEGFRLPAQFGSMPSGRITLGVRPEVWELSTVNDEESVPVEVNLVEKLGSESFAYASISGEAKDKLTGKDELTIRLDRHQDVKQGDILHIKPRAGEIMAFDNRTGYNLVSKEDYELSAKSAAKKPVSFGNTEGTPDPIVNTGTVQN